ISCSYMAFEPVTYSVTRYPTEIVGMLSFSAQVLIRLDADTFSPLDATESLQKAVSPVYYAQPSGSAVWSQGNSQTNRFYLANDIMSTNFTAYRQALYDYHRKGMDVMASNPLLAKNEIFKAIQLLNNNHKVRPTNLPNRMFFDAKSDE